MHEISVSISAARSLAGAAHKPGTIAVEAKINDYASSIDCR